MDCHQIKQTNKQTKNKTKQNKLKKVYFFHELTTCTL